MADQNLLRATIRGATRVVACSEALARQTAEVFPSAADRVTWVHNALGEPAAVRDTAARCATAPFVLCVCRAVSKKGIDTLLHAFVHTASEFPHLSLVIIGDGPLLEENRSLAQRLGIAHRVQFKGDIPRQDVSRFFAECEVLVLPSRVEPFGLVLLEAACYNKAIVATRVGGIPEIITNGVNGLLVEPDDPEAMATQIVTVLRDRPLAARLGGQARETLLARFLWKERIKDYIGVYEGDGGPSVMPPPGSHPGALDSKRPAPVDAR